MTRSWLVQARKEKMLSQRDLGNLVGVTETSVQAWEKGLFTPYPRHQRALCEVLEIDVRSHLEAETSLKQGVA